MNKLNQTGKLVAGAVVLIVVTALVVKYGGGRNATPAPNVSSNSSSTTAGNVSAGTTSSRPSGNGPSRGAKRGDSSLRPSAAPKASLITLITPVPGETWTIATYNPISWTQEASVTGQIELLDATTMRLVGVILTEAGPHQTSYSWNTRDVSLSRTNPSKTTVTPGRYIIRISFDGNDLSPITSQPITLAQ